MCGRRNCISSDTRPSRPIIEASIAVVTILSPLQCRLIFVNIHTTAVRSPLRAYYNCDSSTIRVRFERDSSTIRARHATTRYEVFRALAYEIDSSTPRESVVGVSCMLIDSSMHTFTLYLHRPTLHRVCEYARNCLYKRN